MKKFVVILIIPVLILIISGCGATSLSNSAPAIYSYMDLMNNSGQTITKISSKANGETDWITGFVDLPNGKIMLVTFGYTVDFSTTEFKIEFQNGDIATKIINMVEHGQYSLNVNHTTDATQWVFTEK